MKRFFLASLLLIATGLLAKISAQEIAVVFPDKQVALNQMFRLQVQVRNGHVRRIAGFPEIPGFQKAGTSSGSNVQIINGRMSQTITITQNYRPTKKGTFRVQPFTLNVDGNNVASEGTTVQVTDPVQRRRSNPFAFDPFGDPFGMFEQSEPEYVDVEADAFFALSPSKRNIYVGEGVHVVLAFYEAASNKALMDFHNLQEQLSNIINELKPENCWEENFQIMEIKREELEIKGKKYNRYKLFEATFFPLAAKDIVFPRLNMKMVKYNRAKRRSFFQPSMKKGFQTFSTRPSRVRVKELPPHPLRQKVAVGKYELRESLNDTMTFTNEGLSYTFEVRGRGNISSLPKPIQSEPAGLEVYPPGIKAEIKRGYGKVYGSKTFEYFLVPKQTGKVDLGEAFFWPYFDPERERYDTLRPSKAFLTKLGEKAAGLTAFVEDPFYRQMGEADNRLVSLQKDFSGARWAFGLLVALFSLLFFLIYLRNQKQS